MNELRELNKILDVVLAYGPSRKKKKKAARTKKTTAKRRAGAEK